MPQDLIRALVPVIIALLLLWLLYRIKRNIRLLIREEIFKDFPSVKDAIDKFDQRIGFLTAEIEALERKIAKIKERNLGEPAAK